MFVADFLLERCQEILDCGSCSYEIDRVGNLDCTCADPQEQVRAALRTMALVLWLAELEETGETYLRMLADSYADHPDYRVEWHQLPNA